MEDARVGSFTSDDDHDDDADEMMVKTVTDGNGNDEDDDDDGKKERDSRGCKISLFGLLYSFACLLVALFVLCLVLICFAEFFNSYCYCPSS